MRQKLEYIGIAAGKSAIASVSAYGLLSFLVAFVNKLEGYPRDILDTNPNITSSEILNEFGRYTKSEFEGAMWIIFGGLGALTILYILVNSLILKPFWHTQANVEVITEPPNQGNDHTPTNAENITAIAKTGGVATVTSFFVNGVVQGVRSIAYHDFPKEYARELPEVSDVIKAWSALITRNLIWSSIFLGAALISTPFVARKPIKALFWNQNNDSGEGSHLVSNRLSETAPDSEKAEYNQTL